jgi:hypothetical protein
VNNGIGKMCKEAGCDRIEALSQHLSGGSRVNYEGPRSGLPVCVPRFEEGN